MDKNHIRKSAKNYQSVCDAIREIRLRETESEDPKSGNMSEIKAMELLEESRDIYKKESRL